ncbi:MAG TPA: M48 family metallopeptidase [Candidatus Manganitrophaceae bacterium]|nr:M48 family metallopeptidase [Candidatus Manganitrophaceae bacterium]
MNLYAVIILSALLVEYGLNLAADFLNLKALQNDLPEEVAGLYDAAAYRTSQEYTRVNTKLGMIAATAHLAALLLFWFAGGFDALDQFLRRGGLGPIPSGILYIGILVVARNLLSFPFRLYRTFVIEERFGFNKTTPATFAADLLKGLLLGLFLGAPLLTALLAFFESGGAGAWLYAWGVTAVFILLIQVIAPTWIMPIFNKFVPLQPGELRERILSYARSVDFPLDNVFVIDGSRRSGKSNAFFTGFGKHKRIALFDTLIEKQTVPELVAVLAHEIGHYKKRHVLIGMVISILHLGLMLFLLSLFIGRRGLYDAFYLREPSVYAGLLFFGLLYTPIEFFLSLFLQALSRKNEYEADRFAVETIDRPEVMAEALKKLSVHNLSNLTPHPFYVFLNYSHPPILQRVRAILGQRPDDPASGSMQKA